MITAKQLNSTSRITVRDLICLDNIDNEFTEMNNFLMQNGSYYLTFKKIGDTIHVCPWINYSSENRYIVYNLIQCLLLIKSLSRCVYHLPVEFKDFIEYYDVELHFHLYDFPKN